MHEKKYLRPRFLYKLITLCSLFRKIMKACHSVNIKQLTAPMKTYFSKPQLSFQTNPDVLSWHSPDTLFSQNLNVKHKRKAHAFGWLYQRWSQIRSLPHPHHLSWNFIVIPKWIFLKKLFSLFIWKYFLRACSPWDVPRTAAITPPLSMLILPVILPLYLSQQGTEEND